MSKKIPSHIWESQRLAKDYETLDCPELDSHRDFKMDPSGHYTLIKLDFDQYRVEVAICNPAHEIIKIFSGRKPQDIYDAIFSFEQKNKLKWFTQKTHIAYLGKELKKAEIALVTGNSAYFQE